MTGWFNGQDIPIPVNTGLCLFVSLLMAVVVVCSLNYVSIEEQS